MTRAEFWAAEGEREGRPGSEVRQDFYDQLAESEAEERQQLLDNPLDFVLRCYAGEDENDPDLEIPKPVEVLEVIELKHSSGLTQTSTTMVARCRCADDTVHVLNCWYSYWSGSMTEPPDYDIGVALA